MNVHQKQETSKKQLSQNQTMIKEVVLTLRASGLRYEQMAHEQGKAVDTLRRWVYGLSEPSELSVMQFKNWAKRYKELLHGVNVH